MHWMAYASFAIVLWGVCGLFMKLGTNCVSARSMVIWVTVGFLVLLPFMSSFTPFRFERDGHYGWDAGWTG